MGRLRWVGIWVLTTLCSCSGVVYNLTASPPGFSFSSPDQDLSYHDTTTFSVSIQGISQTSLETSHLQSSTEGSMSCQESRQKISNQEVQVTLSQCRGSGRIRYFVAANALQSPFGGNNAASGPTFTTDVRFEKISVSLFASCGYATDDQLYCWGDDSSGQLGNGPAITAQQEVPYPVDMSNFPTGTTITQIEGAKSNHFCALTGLGEIYCWGEGSTGELGDGAQTDSDIPVKVDSSMLTGGEVFTQITSGSDHSCAITSLNNAYCWGGDSDGKLGTNGGGQSNVPTLIDTSALAGGEHFVELRGGYGHTCGTTNLQNVFCWGADNAGQLGNVAGAATLPDAIDNSLFSVASTNGVGLGAGYMHTCGLESGGANVYCWGRDGLGELGNDVALADAAAPVAVDLSLLPVGNTIETLAVGFDSAFALDNEHNLYWWGYKLDTTWADWSNDFPVPVMVDLSNLQSDEYLSELAAGQTGQCGLTNKGRVYCWGEEWRGEFGNGAQAMNTSLVPLAVDLTALQP